MKKIKQQLLLILLLCLGIVSCSNNNASNVSSITSNNVSNIISTSNVVSSSNNMDVDDSTTTTSNRVESSTGTIQNSVTSTTSNVITKESSSTSTKVNVPSSIISNKVESYNPDGTVKLPVPKISINSTWGQNGKFYDINNEFPDGFSCIYGKQIIDTPPYYATGNYKITYPNSGTRLGFQSPLFEEDLKLEVWFTVDEIHRNNDTLDKTNPWIRIYGFSKDGKLVTTKEIESPTSFTERDYHYAFNGEGVNYFELRFMAQPHEGSKCYNFGISQIGVKSFPYPYND